MPDLTPATARQFLAELTLLSKRMGIALGVGADGMELFKADPDGQYRYAEAGLADGSMVFDRIEWVEPSKRTT
jgi:hypothetical protein